MLSGWIAWDNRGAWMSIQREIFKAPQVEREFELQPVPSHAKDSTRAVVEQCEWYTFFDICVLLAAFFDTEDWKQQHPEKNKNAFQERINQAFADNCIGYELRNGEVERIGPPYVDAVVSQARQVLQDPDYAGSNEQFEKAIGFLNERPNPDTANCVKDAIGAVEGLARIVTGNDNLILSKILDLEPLKSKIPGTLRQMMHKLYAYRGDAEGAAHGQTSIGQITVEEAELALGVSASCMIYLAKKFGKEP